MMAAMRVLPKFIIAAASFLSAYWVTELAIWGIARWDLGVTLCALTMLLLLGGWLEGYFSQGGLKKFIRQELPPKLHNLLLELLPD
jgi:hypothetical protein